MVPLNPPSVQVLERALADPLSAARVTRMLAALGRSLSEVEILDDAAIPELIRRQDWLGARRRQGWLGAHRDPALVFGTLRFDAAPPVAPVLAECPAGTPSSLVAQLLGHGGRGLAREQWTSGRGVCRARVQFDTLYGCPHGCAYCAGGQVAVVNVNLEEFIEREVAPAAAAEPWQKVFMLNSSLSDTLCFEPEYGLAELLASWFAGTADQAWLIHTKSANVDALLDLDHRGRTVMLWSLTGASAARLIEPATASPTARIEAARRCQAAGYPVRFKLKPIVPVKGWRDEYRELIARLFATVRPESVGMFMLAWMEAAELESILDPDLLDPDFLAAMRQATPAMAGINTGPFPPAARAEVYRYLIHEVRRHDQQVPLFLCTETLELWRELGSLLGTDPAHYVCGCGPQSAPGLTRLDRVLVPTELR